MHIFYVLLDTRLCSDASPVVIFLKRKKLPPLGGLTRDSQVQHTHKEKESEDLTQNTMQRTKMIIDSGDWDEMKIFQLPSAPVLKVGSDDQMLFFYKDHQSGEKRRVNDLNYLQDQQLNKSYKRKLFMMSEERCI